jgi:hypothetical protein
MIFGFLSGKGYTAEPRNDFRDGGILWRSFRLSPDDAVSIVVDLGNSGGECVLVSSMFHGWDKTRIETFEKWTEFYDVFESGRARFAASSAESGSPDHDDA